MTKYDKLKTTWLALKSFCPEHFKMIIQGSNDIFVIVPGREGEGLNSIHEIVDTALYFKLSNDY